MQHSLQQPRKMLMLYLQSPSCVGRKRLQRRLRVAGLHARLRSYIADRHLQ